MSAPKIGLLPATALNVSMIVGAGVFATVPLMVKELPGWWSVLGWLAAGLLILCDALVWCELSAALPGPGGSCHYLRESYGRDGWGKPLAFLFVWQFLLSGPLELASGLVALASFSTALSPAWREFNEAHTWTQLLWEDGGVRLTFSPTRALGLAVGLFAVGLLYRRIDNLSRFTVAVGLGVLALIAALLIACATQFDASRALEAVPRPDGFAGKLGAVMLLAVYSYLGYYTVCYVGHEVRDPGRTLPRSILLSAVLVVVLFALLHIAMLGVVGWREIPTEQAQLDNFNLPAEVARRTIGDWAGTAVAALLVCSCFGSVYAGLLGYSRIPYGAARDGYFLSYFATEHPTRHFPHRGLLLVAALTLFWSMFDLQTVINAFIATRILEQFAAQIIGLAVLRRTRPDLPRPFRVWLYPLPLGLALVGWLFLYATSGWFAIGFGAITLAVGALVYWWRFGRFAQ